MMSDKNPRPKFDAAGFIAGLPARPGVYLFYNAAGKALYVGKASNLKKRVASYFRRTGRSAKTRLMTGKIAHAEIQQTPAESDALLLENDLIKDKRPQYNIQLRDDKSFPYIRFSKRDDFPRFTLYRGRRGARDDYFGPYPNVAAAREMLHHLHKIFRLRQCADSVFRNRARPCLQYQIKRCSAPCVGLIGRAAYAEDARQARAMLRGRDASLLDELGEKMDRAAAKLDYETAAAHRDRIKLLQLARGKPPTLRVDADAVAVAVAADMVCFGVLSIRQGRNLGGRFHLQKNPLRQTAAELLAAFLPQNYLGAAAPREILVAEKITGRAALQQALSRQLGRRVAIHSRCRTQRARWLAAAQINTDDYLRGHLASRGQIESQCAALGKLLNLRAPPARIECFDISHSQGERAVGACVVFNNHGALPNEYRKFNLRDITPGDDYAAMRQVLTRRYKRVLTEDGAVPEVILVDGGKGQLSAARRALDELQLREVAVAGVAKGKARRAGDEILHLHNRGRGIRLGPAAPALHLIQRIRDEAHRFCLTGHRRARAAARAKSPLQKIAGIGAVRRRALLRHFGGLQEVARAGREELARAPGINAELAARIYDRFHA